ncbi:hypothetical protein OsJ_17689 [Oryza sativa Japonica Group]|nr:hypothetical protein OsJ_17689 [Oryza sativa Japonica Group]
MARRSTANHRCSDFGFGYGGRVGCGELAGAKARFIGEGGAKGGRVEHLSRHVRQEHGGSGESRQLCRRALSVGHGISRAARRLARGAAGGRHGRAERCRVRVQPRGGFDWLRPAPGAAATLALQFQRQLCRAETEAVGLVASRRFG